MLCTSTGKTGQVYGCARDTVYFFFSSRRRHTRCSRDWSSDVCSSDLDGGSPSSSRVLALMHSMVTCGVLIYVSIHNHSIPDGTVLTGLGAFATAPYAIKDRKSVV